MGGRHPFCRCFATAIIADEKQRDAYYEANAAGEDVEGWEFEGAIKDMPEGWNNWVADNEERIASAKSMPYFIKDNFKDGKIEGGLKWVEEIKPSREEAIKLGADFVKDPDPLDTKLWRKYSDNWEELTQEERILALERAKATGIVDMETIDMSPTILRREEKKNILDYIDQDLYNYRTLGERSVEDNLHYIVKYDGEQPKLIDIYSADEFKKIPRKNLQWACTNQGLPSYGDCYWTRDKEAMQSMLEFTGFAEMKNGKFIRNSIRGAMDSYGAIDECINERARFILHCFNTSLGNAFNAEVREKIISAIKEYRSYGERHVELLQGSNSFGILGRNDQSRGTITISNFTYKVTLKGGRVIQFNAYDKLLEGIELMKSGRDWDFTHEYAIEVLWHEVMHNATKAVPAVVGRKEYKLGASALEASHQFVARSTYHNFMKKLTGKYALHRVEVMELGFGYKQEVENLRTLIKELELKENEASEALLSVIHNTDKNRAVADIAKSLARKSGRSFDYIREALEKIDFDSEDFKIAIKGG